jgi:hypothetical protein
MQSFFDSTTQIFSAAEALNRVSFRRDGQRDGPAVIPALNLELSAGTKSFMLKEVQSLAVPLIYACNLAAASRLGLAEQTGTLFAAGWWQARRLVYRWCISYGIPDIQNRCALALALCHRYGLQLPCQTA